MDSTSPPLQSLGSIVQWLDSMIDNMLLTAVAGNLERIIAAIWLPLEIGVLISLMIYGYLIATQQVSTPYGQALGTIVKVVVIVAIIEAGGFYQTQIMGAMLALPDELVQIISGSPDAPRDVLSDFHNAGVETATRLQDRAPDFWSDIPRAILFSIISLMIVLMYAMVTIIGLLLMTVAKVGMALLVMVGPIFIAFLLFDKTNKYFDYWLSQALYFALYGMLFSLVFSLLMGMLGYIQRVLIYMTDAGEINILQIMGVVFLVGCVAIFLLKLPSTITSKITGGEGVDMPFIGKL